MKVKLELCLTRTVTLDVVESDLNDLNHLNRQLESPHHENIHSMKIIEVDGRYVGTSLETGSALGISKDQNVVKFHQHVPALLPKLRRNVSSRFSLIYPK